MSSSPVSVSFNQASHGSMLFFYSLSAVVDKGQESSLPLKRSERTERDFRAEEKRF